MMSPIYSHLPRLRRTRPRGAFSGAINGIERSRRQAVSGRQEQISSAGDFPTLLAGLHAVEPPGRRLVFS